MGGSRAGDPAGPSGAPGPGPAKSNRLCARKVTQITTTRAAASAPWW